ncbi:MAG: hypothetical protein AB7P02_05270 [Alphaproteobacteria bacterium]
MKARLAAALALVSTAVMAHGEADWIEDNKAFVGIDGHHCCSPVDCGRIPETAVREVEPGHWIVVATGQEFREGQKGLYTSKDVTFWACKFATDPARFRCLFVPTKGF